MEPIKKNAFLSQEKKHGGIILKFKTETTYQMPITILTSDIQQFQSVLTFAAKLIDLEKTLSTEYIKETLFADYVRKLEETHAKDIEMLKKSGLDDLSSKLSPLIELISEKEAQFNKQLELIKSENALEVKALIKEKNKSESDATAAKQEIEEQLQKEIRGLRKQISEKESEVQSLSKGEGLIRDQCRAESERLIKIIEQKNTSALEALRESFSTTIKLKEEALQQREARILQKEEEFQTTIQRNASSSFRGQDGEMHFEQLAETNMKWKLTNTSKIPHSCDYSSEIHGSPVFFEIKNYTDPVRNEEVLKFLRDMKEHPEVSIGIFISWNTRIVGKDQMLPISIEWINDSQCAIYIQPLKDLEINATLALIDQIIKINSIYKKLIGSKGDVSESVILQPRIDKARVYIDQYISEASSLLKRVVNDKKRHLELVESTYSSTIASLKTQSAAIATVLSILTGEYAEDTTVDPSLIVDPEPSKPKKSAKKN
jgi:hypothetical protein